MRIVSLDYCADQYVLKLADRGRILAVSPDAAKPFSYMRAAATGLPHVAPRAEDVLALRPDLIVRSYGGGPNAAAFFERAGVPVLQIGSSEDLPGVRATLIAAGQGLGEPVRAAAVAEEMDRRLAAIRPRADRHAALYMTATGVTSGPGGLIDQIITASGHTNFQREPGWHALPLERLTRERPDIVAAAFFGSTPDRWSAARHPVAAAQLNERPVVPIDDAWTACGGWFVLDAIEAMAKAP